ncbi:MAG TPA: hypothetical protein VGK59_23750, partial [Ohtaekwangia sp.]
MKRLFFLFLLIPVFCDAQLIANHGLMGRQARDTVAIPYPFFANSVDTDSIRTEWIDIGADTYVLESDDNFDFSSPTTEYSGTNLSYTLTGLGANVKRYFRLHAETDGLVNSPYVYDSATTFPFIPVAHYEFTGLETEDNIYGDWSSGDDFNQFNSVINYSGTPLVPVGAGGLDLASKNYTPYPSYATAHCAPSTPWALGDFEINILVRLVSTISNNQIFSNSSLSDNYIRFNTYSQIRFASTTGVTLTLDTSLEDGKSYFISFIRSGTTFTVIIKDVNGVVQTKSGTCPTTTVTFNRVFHTATNYYIQRINIMDRPLTDAERDAVRDYLKRPVLIPEPNDTTTEPKDLSWNTFSGNYITNSDFPNIVSTSFVRDKFLAWNDDYTFINVQKKYESPTYGEDLIYVLRPGQFSTPIEMGVPGGTSEDVHNTGGICFWNNLLVHFEQSKHHSDGFQNSIVVKMFGKNMNMVAYKQIPITKGVVSYAALNLQYHQVAIIDDVIYIVAQERSGKIVMLISDDEWSSFKKFDIIGVSDSDDFLYHQLIYSEDKIILTIDHEVQPGNDHRASYILVAYPSVSATTLWNVAGTFSKDISTSGQITLTEGDANYLLGTAITGSPGDLTSV